MPTNYAFTCVVPWNRNPYVLVPWNRNPYVLTGDVDVSTHTDGNHAFQKTGRSVRLGNRTVSGLVYFARNVKEAEWPQLDHLIVEALKTVPATERDFSG